MSSELLVKQKAADLAREMNVVDWEGSEEEWLHRSKNRHYFNAIYITFYLLWLSSWFMNIV